MAKTDAKVEVIKQKCDQTESLRIAGQRHLDEAPKEQQKTSGAWMSSKLCMQMLIGLMAMWLGLTSYLIYLVSSGKIKLPG